MDQTNPHSVAPLEKWLAPIEERPRSETTPSEASDQGAETTPSIARLRGPSEGAGRVDDAESILASLYAELQPLNTKRRLDGLSAVEEARRADLLAEIDVWEAGQREEEKESAAARLEALASRILQVHGEIVKKR